MAEFNLENLPDHVYLWERADGMAASPRRNHADDAEFVKSTLAYRWKEQRDKLLKRMREIVNEASDTDEVSWAEEIANIGGIAEDAIVECGGEIDAKAD